MASVLHGAQYREAADIWRVTVNRAEEKDCSNGVFSVIIASNETREISGHVPAAGTVAFL